jgi:hypothetical protein
MKYAFLFALGFPLAFLQDTAESRRAIAIVKKADGTITFDEKAPGRVVIGINL